MGAPEGADTEHISIHALLAESDAWRKSARLSLENFYPRSPCGERPRDGSRRPDRDISIHALLAESDRMSRRQHLSSMKFLSTLSLRRATIQLEFNSLESKHFYPRSPCGERHFTGSDWVLEFPISIHALLAESDQKWPKHQTQTQNFYPRSPCGERHTIMLPKARYFDISIHALLAESDTHPIGVLVTIIIFLSTLSLRRATT